MDLLERRITRGSNSLDCRVNVFGIAAYYNYRWTTGETSSEIGRRVLPLTGAAGISSSPGVASKRHRQQGVSGVAAKITRLGLPERQLSKSFHYCSMGAPKTSGVVATATTWGRRSGFRGRSTVLHFGSAGVGCRLIAHQHRLLTRTSLLGSLSIIIV